MELSSFERQVEADLEWREAELAIFRQMLSTKQSGKTRTQVMFRSAWALLYAHYEGFSKFCLDLYIEYICRTHTHCRLLPNRLFVFLIDKKIKQAKTLPPDDVFAFFSSDIVRLRNEAPQAVQIDTDTNLWPDLLEKILLRLDLGEYNILCEKKKIGNSRSAQK